MCFFMPWFSGDHVVSFQAADFTKWILSRMFTLSFMYIYICAQFDGSFSEGRKVQGQPAYMCVCADRMF